MFKKILIANRGEIAIRVINTCRTLGIKTVAVYSEADTNSLHRWAADEAVQIGPAAPGESYLVIDKIINAAKETGAEAIHPGYGFLSENPQLPGACVEAGIVFIGPSAESMRLMGNKISAREAAIEANAPITPGLEGAATDLSVFQKKADEVGYPVLIKAAAGGGGKGMRLVEAPTGLADAIEAAAREAEKAFGNSAIYLEKYLVKPRHVEFQVFGDSHGNYAHLFERECSIQRRHQKIIEETPSVALNDELRARMGEAAVSITRAAKYVGAGTIEFLLDDSGEFYFLEMNTRLQVEHPITEEVTGLDLVAEQIRIASGRELSEELRGATQRGHAIECRIYAEDAENNFFPSSGEVLRYTEPSGPGIRVDSGIEEGSVVGIDYDPILAKVVTYGETREAARLRMLDALRRYKILGVKTCNAYLIDILESEAFISGRTHTAFIDDEMPEIADPSDLEIRAAAAIAAVALESAVAKPSGATVGQGVAPSLWDTLGTWRIGESG